MAAKTLKDYANILTGTQVIVEDEDGSLYTGILREFSDELEVCLSFAQKLPTSPDSQYILSNRNTMKEFRLKAVRLTGDYCAKESESTFRTDHEIGCNGDIGSDNEFQQWEDDGDGLDDKLGDLNETKNEKWRKKKKAGWSVDEMFKANIDKCVGESNFDENLTQYSNVEVGQRSREELERATELAKLIENNPISKRNALLENDDEERDLDAVTTFKEDKEAKERQRQEAKPNHNKKSPTPTPVTKPTLPAAEKKIEMKNEPVDENEGERNVKAEEPQKKQFQFNPNASPFVPTKGRDLNSKPPTPAANNFNSPANFPSHQQNQHVPTFVPVQMPTAVPMQPAPHMGGLPPPNLVYGMYPQQQVVQNVMYNPLYANAGQQPTMFMQPNQTFLLQQQGINPQQQPQFITMGMAAAPPPQQQNVQQSHSRTGTPTNGNNVMHQPQQQQSLMDANATGNGQVQQQQQPMTTLYQNHAQLVPTGPNNALPLMNIPQLQSMMPMPASSVAVAYSHQFQQQMPPNYVQQQQHHQQQQQQQQYSALVNHQQQQPQQLHQQAQPYALSRSSSVHLPQHFQQQTLNLQQAVANQQNAAAAAAGVYVTNSPYATPLMQQPVSYYIPQQHGMMAPSIVPPPPHLTHTMHPPAGQHGRQQ